MPQQRPRPGVMEPVADGVRRILADNPSPMTFWGTNSFVLGEGAVAVVDPGPDDPAHLAAILDGLAPGERVAQILVTHAHLDHSAGARPLAALTGAPVIAFGDARAGRSLRMAALVEAGLTGGGEGVDVGFVPDETLADGERFSAGGIEVETLWTPGHFANHIGFALGDTILTGDLVMGWSSTLISPPDGDLGAFMASCVRLAARRAALFLPAHGAPVTDPAGRLDWLIAHRKGREAEVLAALATGPARLETLTRAIYADTPPALIPAAMRNVLAHLIDLDARGLVAATPKLAADALFSTAR